MAAHKFKDPKLASLVAKHRAGKKSAKKKTTKRRKKTTNKRRVMVFHPRTSPLLIPDWAKKYMTVKKPAKKRKPAKKATKKRKPATKKRKPAKKTAAQLHAFRVKQGKKLAAMRKGRKPTKRKAKK